MGRRRLRDDVRTQHPRLYGVWSDMKRRCNNPDREDYQYYGARGISVCDRWANDFYNFFIDMGDPPEGMTIDRKDNNLGYSPENCRWVAAQAQSSNRRYCTYLDDDGETVTLKEYCRRHDINYSAIHTRVWKLGWEVERAISEPIQTQVRHTVEGMSVRAAAAKYGIGYTTVHMRIATGWPLELAVKSPVGSKLADLLRKS